MIHAVDEHGLGYIFHSVHHVLHAPGDQVDGVGAGDTGKQDIIGSAVDKDVQTAEDIVPAVDKSVQSEEDILPAEDKGVQSTEDILPEEDKDVQTAEDIVPAVDTVVQTAEDPTIDIV